MKSQPAIGMLKVLAYIGFYLLIFFTALFLVKSMLNVAGIKPDFRSGNFRELSLNVRSFGSATSPVITNAGATAKYEQVNSRYVVSVHPNTPAGYYTVFIKTVYMALGIWVLWLFIRVLKSINKGESPFHLKIIRYLRLMALAFILNDVIKALDYLVEGRILRQLFPAMHFQLETEIGNGLITGLIIWVIAFVYASGVKLQTDQALTI
ncbi:DUF2975 domain-containing protein [Niabella sp. CC-SYL272]|uniref:DUF2975 domain-containing protein n=1 Tax=Niabella agricola TaxID=2891571 RepID=UPI001F1A2A5F|nr:DUF2975 domain-containing protein [Niabella agricola]MCF3111328.1 DUF2975 domain-containing protein [Niabella agricola]